MARPPRAWLTKSALVLRDPALYTSDLTIHRAQIRAVTTERRQEENSGINGEAGVLSPFVEPHWSLVRLVMRSGYVLPRPDRTGWNGSWAFWSTGSDGKKKSGDSDELITHSVRADVGDHGGRYRVLILSVRDPQKTVEILENWLRNT